MKKRPDSATPMFAFARGLGQRSARKKSDYVLEQQALRARGLPGVSEVLARLVDPALFDPEPTGAFSRRRNFDFATLTQGFIWQALSGQATCRDAVLQVQAMGCKNDHAMIPSDTGAYCMARSNLPLRRLEQIRGALCERVEGQAERLGAGLAQAGWGGREVLLIDGSGVQVEDTPANVAAYGYPSNVRPGCGFPCAGLAVLFNLRTGAWIGHRVGPHRVHDVKLGLPLLQEKVQPKQIVVADRAYTPYWMFAWLQGRGADGVFRIASTRRTDLRRGQRLGKDERLMTWQKPAREDACPLSEEQYAELPDQLCVRVLRVRLAAKGQRTRAVVLATTLLDRDEFPSAQLSELLRGRWQVEMRLDEVKNTLGMDPLRCKSPGMVERALVVFACAYNVVRTLMLESALRADVPLARLSFQGTADALCAWMSVHPASGALGRTGSLAWWTRLLDVIARDLVPERPDRHEPRVLKRRPKDFPWMTRPRHQKRARKKRLPQPSLSGSTPKTKS